MSAVTRNQKGVIKLSEVTVLREGDQYEGIEYDQIFYLQGHFERKTVTELLCKLNKSMDVQTDMKLIRIIHQLKNGTLICQ